MWFDSASYIDNGYDKTGYETQLKVLRRGIYLDTAALYILVVGHYDKKNGTSFVQRFQSKSKLRDRSYKTFDYDYLLAFLNSLGLKDYNLFVTPQIFTEFIQHIWDYVDDPEHFSGILKESFETKWYLKGRNVNCFDFLNHDDFLGKKFEVGDISIVLAENNSAFRSILTDDEGFAEVSDKKYDFLTIYYDEIRNATILFKSERRAIPHSFLVEPEQDN